MRATRVGKLVLLLNGKGYQNKLEAAVVETAAPQAGKLLLITLTRLPCNIFQHPHAKVRTDRPACFLWSKPHKPDADF